MPKFNLLRLHLIHGILSGYPSLYNEIDDNLFVSTSVAERANRANNESARVEILTLATARPDKTLPEILPLHLGRFRKTHPQGGLRETHE